MGPRPEIERVMRHRVAALQSRIDDIEQRLGR
jgi:hypothetical protein